MRKHRVTIVLTLLAGLVGWAVGYFTRPEPEPDPLLEKASRIRDGMTLDEVEAILGQGEGGEGFGLVDVDGLNTSELIGPIRWRGASWCVAMWFGADRVALIRWYPYTPSPAPSWWARVCGRLGL